MLEYRLERIYSGDLVNRLNSLSAEGWTFVAWADIWRADVCGDWREMLLSKPADSAAVVRED